MPAKTISIGEDIQRQRHRAAEEFRQRISQNGTLIVNLVSSPGAGKTSLLQAMAQHWSGQYSMAVLVGDIATDRDADRLRPFVPVEQLTTGGACHLELPLVQQGFERLPQNAWDFLIIENIGNLVCPASHDLGEHLRIVLLSSTEGDDKPGKYPKMFRTSQALVISKADLLPWVPFQVRAAIDDAHAIQPGLRSFVTSTVTKEGIKEFCSYLEAQRSALVPPAGLTIQQGHIS